jgi:hypothetical protein
MPEFLNGESVRIKASGVVTIVHHSTQYPGEDWKFFIESEGRFLPFAIDELERVNED